MNAGRIYFLIFWFPTLVSAALMIVAWRTDLFRRPWIPAGLALLAFLVQFRAGVLSPWWAAALVLQTVLAVVLMIRIKLG